MTMLVGGGRFGAGETLDQPGIVLASTALASGGFVQLWQTSSSQGALFADIYDANGNRVGPSIEIAPASSTPDVVGLSGGGFAIAYTRGQFSSFEIVSQVFDAQGTAVGATATIASSTSLDQVDQPTLAALSDDRFAVVWGAGNTVSERDVLVRVVDGGNTPITAAQRIDTNFFTSSNDSVALADGRVLIAYGGGATWNGETGRLLVSTYDPASDMLSPQPWLQIMSPAGARPINMDLTLLANGNVLVSWVEYGPGNGSGRYDFKGAVYDAAGTKLADAFSVLSPRGYTSVAALPDGGFAIAYDGAAGTASGIVTQLFDAAGAPAGEAFVISDPAQREVYTPVLTGFGSGDLVIAWTHYDVNGSGDSTARLLFSAIGGTENGETLTGTADADFIVGLGGDDLLLGGGGDDLLIGGAGGDVLDGGAGNDAISYEDSAQPMAINLSDGFATGDNVNFDTLISIENVTGSALGDALTGDAGANRLDGGAGNDILEGLGGADTLIGGEGVDEANYQRSNAGVTVNLAAGVGAGGHAEGDTLTGTENVTGSAFNDVLTGSASANVLDGRAGDDTLIGGINADTLLGGDGTDTASYANSASRVTVNLATGTGQGGDAQSDTLREIENVVGSALNDALTGNAGANALNGMAGDDVLTGGAGDDLLDGGDGLDTAVLAIASRDAVGQMTGGALQLRSAEGSDTLRSIELLRFTDRDVPIGRFEEIDALYRDYGQRAAALGELIVWTDQLARGVSIAQVRDAIVNDALGAGAIRAEYQRVFARDATPQEVGVWQGIFRGGAHFSALTDALTDEYTRMFAPVDALYQQFGGRAATTAELALWRNAQDGGTSLDTIRSIIIDDVLGASGINEDYRDFFGRDATAEEIAVWRGIFHGGAPAATLNQALLSEPQGLAQADAAVARLYEDFGGRAASAGEIAAWRGAIRSGANLDDVRDGIVDDALGAQGIDGEYRDYMGRAATAGEIEVWRGAFRADTPALALREAILGTDTGRAYTAGVIDDYYEALFGRHADAGETAVWTDMFRRGTDSDTLLDTLFRHPAATGVVSLSAQPGPDTVRPGSADLYLIAGFDPAADRLDLRAWSQAHPGALGPQELHGLDGSTNLLLGTDPEHGILLTGISLAQYQAMDVLF